jgi:hypothetical protein
MPNFQKKQAKAKLAQDQKKISEKVDQVRVRNYIECGEVQSLTHMFHVPKGADDIQMVYNGTSSGLNAVLWAPHFGLPVMQHTLRSLLPGYYQCDMDVGEMFLNYWLHPDLRPYAGVDVTHLQPRRSIDKTWDNLRGNDGNSGVETSWALLIPPTGLFKC